MDSEKIIKAKGNLNFEEHLDKRAESIGVYFFGLIFIFGGSVIINYFIEGSISAVVHSIVDDWIVNLIFFPLGCLLMLKVWMYRRKKMFKNSNIRKEHIYTINDEGITRAIEKNSLFIKWSNISKIIEKDNIFRVHVVYNNKRPIYIPKSFFTTESNILDVDELERGNPIYIPKSFFYDESDIMDFKEILQKKNIKFN